MKRRELSFQKISLLRIENTSNMVIKTYKILMYYLFSMNQSEDVQSTVMSGSGITSKQYLYKVQNERLRIPRFFKTSKNTETLNQYENIVSLPKHT